MVVSMFNIYPINTKILYCKKLCSGAKHVTTTRAISTVTIPASTCLLLCNINNTYLQVSLKIITFFNLLYRNCICKYHPSKTTLLFLNTLLFTSFVLRRDIDPCNFKSTFLCLNYIKFTKICLHSLIY